MFEWSVTGEGSALLYEDDAITAINGILKEIGKENLPVAEQMGTNTMDGYFNAAEAEITKNEGSWKSWFGWLPKWAKDILGIKSPSTVFYAIGSDTWQGFWNACRDKWTELRNWYNANVQPKFTKAYWAEKFGGILSGASSVLTELRKKFEGFSAKIKMPHLTWTTTPATGLVKKALEAINLPTSVPKLNVEWYAQGGFPSMGEMFVAREAGPELVGSIGSRTAVANNDQIVTAVSEGVYRAVLAAMGQQGGSGEMNVYVYLDGRQITSAVEKTQAERGRTVMGSQLGYGWR